MGCKCCKKKDDDEDILIRQSPLICEDLEKPTESRRGTSTTAGSVSASNRPSLQEIRKGASTNQTTGSSGGTIELNTVAAHKGHEVNNKQVPGPPDPLKQGKDVQNPGSVKSVEGESNEQTEQLQSQQDDLKKSSLSTTKDDESESWNTRPRLMTDRSFGGDVKLDITARSSTTLDESKLTLDPDPKSKSPAPATDSFLENPINYIDKNLADLSDQSVISELVEKMELALRHFMELITKPLDKFEKIFEDQKNELGFEMKITGATVSSSSSGKIHATRQSFKVKAKPQEFIFVSNDPDIQNRINSNIAYYACVFAHRSENFSLEVFHSRSKKITMVADSRESIFVKYCKQLSPTEIVSVNKSIVLKDLGDHNPELTTNIQISGFHYKHTGVGSLVIKVSEGATSNEVGVSSVEAYNCTDFKSSVSFMIIKPFLSKSVKEYVKKTMEEVESMRSAGKLGVISLFKAAEATATTDDNTNQAESNQTEEGQPLAVATADVEPKPAEVS